MNRCHIDDQHCLQAALQLPSPHAVDYALDSNASLFLNLYGVPDEHLVRSSEGRCMYTPTGTMPCVLHGAGKGGRIKMRRVNQCVARGAWQPQPGDPTVEYRRMGDLKG